MKWAFKHGTSDSETNQELVYFLMAKIFRFTPDQTDNIAYERVHYMLTLDEEWRKMESDANTKAMKK